jgi:hypothetical protein
MSRCQGVALLKFLRRLLCLRRHAGNVLECRGTIYWHAWDWIERRRVLPAAPVGQ